ncbi:MAG: hypothetical protein IK127_02005 [Clostridia bacterium]|nr:hypothetical protein [Clostridia bacterium]
MNEDPCQSEALPGISPPANPAPAPAEPTQEVALLREALQKAREESEALRTRSLAARTLRDSLAAAGALPEAVELLAGAVPGERLRLTPEGALAGSESLLAGLRSRYGFLFRPKSVLPTPALTPPRDGAPLSQAALRNMTAEEINKRWSEVREALKP